jgi:two-component system, NarL family, nitrate/nitrite response regulator NarL
VPARLDGEDAAEEARVMETTCQQGAGAVRVLVADHHPIFRMGVRRLVESEPGFRVVGEARDASESVALARALAPDLLLIDVTMPGGGGLQALSSVLRLERPPRVLIVTAGISREESVEALRAGARGVLLKDAAPELLCRSLRAVAAGQYWVGRDATADLVGALRGQGDAPRERRGAAMLTARERDIVATVVDGASNKDIALQYGISVQTVKHHLTSIFDKLGMSSRLELAMYAVHHRLVDRHA